MCGIFGFVNREFSKEELMHKTRLLSHRGPDAEGYYFDEQAKAGLGHRRLAIIDIAEHSNQPFFYKDLCMVFNGEIYNYKQIQQELIGLGYSFDTNSDTEVVIKAFHEWGSDCIGRFIGMFAIAIYNKVTQELILIRDRMGVKPLFYSNRDGAIEFSSEIKAILSDKDYPISPYGLYHYLRFGYVLGENTMHRDIFKVPAGHYLKYSAKSGLSTHKYWDLTDYALNQIEVKNENALLDQLEDLLFSSFNYRMVADVPVGIFLSGGIDSSLVTAVLSRDHKDLNTFTIGFDDPRFDEAQLAGKIAAHLNTTHHSKILDFSVARDKFHKFYKIFDEPTHDTSSIPTTIVSEMAAEAGAKVVLSGEGGDELFLGYDSYTRSLNPQQMKLLNSPFLHGMLKSLRSLGMNTIQAKNIGRKLEKLIEITGGKEWIDIFKANSTTLSPYETNQFLAFPEHIMDGDQELVNKIKHLPAVDQYSIWQLKHFMPNDLLTKIDRATMQSSIEGREPLLDHRLVEFALSIPSSVRMKNGEKKYLLKKILERHLPDHLLNQTKRGFVIPLFDWYKAIAKEELAKLSQHGDYMEHFNSKRLNREINNYFSFASKNQPHNTLLSWKLTGLSWWMNEYVA